MEFLLLLFLFLTSKCQAESPFLFLYRICSIKIYVRLWYSHWLVKSQKMRSNFWTKQVRSCKIFLRIFSWLRHIHCTFYLSIIQFLCSVKLSQHTSSLLMVQPPGTLQFSFVMILTLLKPLYSPYGEMENKKLKNNIVQFYHFITLNI